MRRPTIKDVAAKAGVSVGMVSMVLNAKRDANGMPECSVKEMTAKRILDAVEELDYKTNKQAAALRSGRQMMIAVIVPDISNRFFADIAAHIERTAYEKGYTVIFCSSSEDVGKLTHLVEKLYCSSVDGMIVAPCAGSEEIIRKISERGIPLVCLDRVLIGLEDIPSVTLDNIKAGMMAARALKGRHCSHIGVVCYDTRISTLTDRLKGFVDASHACGMDIDVRRLPYHSSLDDFIKVLSRLTDNDVDGLFCPSNNASIKSLKALQSLGIPIGEGLSCIGFDECEVFDTYRPRIARITQSAEDFGRESFMMLLELIEGHTVESKVLQPIFVEGDEPSSDVEDTNFAEQF